MLEGSLQESFPSVVIEPFKYTHRGVLHMELKEAPWRNGKKGRGDRLPTVGGRGAPFVVLPVVRCQDIDGQLVSRNLGKDIP